MIFFQAEDGIREIGVTGVQTCALPILSLIAIWGVLSGRTWVEVMWLVAPDGGCVGTGRPAAGLTAGSGESRRAPFSASEVRKCVLRGKSVYLGGRRNL